MSWYVHAENQLGFSGSETINTRQYYGKLLLDHGVIVKNYLAYNGVFKANICVEYLREYIQNVQYCGVSAHHRNTVAEQSIRTVSKYACTLLLRESLY